MKPKVSLQLLILVNILIIGTFSAAYYTPVSTTACTVSQTTIYATDAASDDSSKWVASCITTTDLVADCYVYDNVNGGCFCNSQTSYKARAIVKKVASDPAKGCVPPAQEVFNGECTRLGSSSYSCVCKISTTNKYEVKLSSDDDDNTINVPKACVVESVKVENCQEYELTTTSTMSGAFEFTESNYKIKCKTCNLGFRQFNTDNPSKYTDSAGDLTVGCPKDGSYEKSSCTEMVYDSDDATDSTIADYIGYKCKCDTSTKTWTRFLSTSSLPITQACFTTSAFTYKDDTNCILYGYSQNAGKISCAKCKESSTVKLISFTGDGTDEAFKFCMTSDEKTGCSGYYVTSKPSASDSLVCYMCKDNYDYIKTAAGIQINGVTGKSTGFCAPKGRWLVEPSICTAYKEPTVTSSVVQDLFLACKDDSSCAVTSGNKIPCYKDTDKANQYGGSCTDGSLSVLAGSSKGKACIASELIQNCKTYATLAPGTSSAPDTASGKCTECEDGFDLVNTQLSKPTGGSPDDTKKICLPESFKDSNCEVYSNNDFSCYKCNNSLSYNPQTKKCAIATDATPRCNRAVYVGDQLICIACGQGSTSVNGVCVSSVPFCSALSSTGVCTACVSGFQLVNNQCVMKPANCEKVNQRGICIQCKSEFVPNSEGNCVFSGSSTQNLCPAGQIPLNGVCVPVQVSIDGCIQYTIDSKCEQCISGNRPSADGSKCDDSKERPGAKPCPPNTNLVTYKRNPSDPLGDCVAVDINCANARDDGFCIGCKNGEYAHTDGKCYKLNLAVEDIGY